MTWGRKNYRFEFDCWNSSGLAPCSGEGAAPTDANA
jgi:hypothetical protein